MCKRILAVLLVALLATSLSGCGIPQALALDEDEHIDFAYFEDDITRFEYDGNVYYKPPVPFLDQFIVNEEAGYAYLGWVGSRFWYSSFVYSNSIEEPVFLYKTETRTTYLREDYDYRTDTFLVEGTGEVICFGEALLETDRKQTSCVNYNTQEVVLSSVKYPLLKAMWYVYIEDNEWYAVSFEYMTPFKLSEDFIDILIDHDLVPACAA